MLLTQTLDQEDGSLGYFLSQLVWLQLFSIDTIFLLLPQNKSGLYLLTESIPVTKKET